MLCLRIFINIAREKNTLLYGGAEQRIKKQAAVRFKRRFITQTIKTQGTKINVLQKFV